MRLLALALALAALTHSVPLADASQTFRAGVDAVRVDVLVTRDGRPVTGLTSADFELRDNGVVQEIDAIAVDEDPVTLVLVLDVSESVEGQPLDHLRNAIVAAADVLSADDQVILYTFSHNVVLAAGPTADLDRLKSAARSVVAGGATTLYDATFAALVMRQRVEGRVVLLVFSDGGDTASWIDPRDVLRAAQQSDIVVYAVTLEQLVERRNARDVLRHGQERRWFRKDPWLYPHQFLPLLAEDTGGAVVVAERSERLRETFVRVVNELKSRYILTYMPRGVSAGGWHAIDVRLEKENGGVTARRGYQRGP